MPNRKISQLPQTSLPTTLEDTDRLPLARSGSTYHILGSDIKSPILSQAQSTMLTKVNSLSARDSATIDLSFSSASYALSANVRDDSISTQHLSANSVTSDKLAPGTVVQTRYTEYQGINTFDADIVSTDLTTPTTSTGALLLSAGLATNSSSNYVLVQGSVLIDSVAAASNTTVLLMVFANTQLIYSVWRYSYGAPISFLLKYTPPNTNNIIYTVRGASSGGSGDLYINRYYFYDYFNTGQQRSTLLLQEIKG